MDIHFASDVFIKLQKIKIRAGIKKKSILSIMGEIKGVREIVKQVGELARVSEETQIYIGSIKEEECYLTELKNKKY